MLDLFLERLQRVEQHGRSVVGFFSENSGPSRPHFVGRLGQIRRPRRFERVLKLAQKLADAAGLDGLDLQAVEPLLEPANEIEELLAFDRRRAGRAIRSGSRTVLLPGMIDPILGAGAKEQRIVKTLALQVFEQILIGPHAAGAGMLAAVPFVENEGEGPAFALLEKQVPAELVVVLLLRADVQDDVGDRQYAMQLLAIGEIVAVQVGRIDDDFIAAGQGGRGRPAGTVARRDRGGAAGWLHDNRRPGRASSAAGRTPGRWRRRPGR